MGAVGVNNGLQRHLRPGRPRASGGDTATETSAETTGTLATTSRSTRPSSPASCSADPTLRRASRRRPRPVPRGCGTPRRWAGVETARGGGGWEPHAAGERVRCFSVGAWWVVRIIASFVEERLPCKLGLWLRMNHASGDVRCGGLRGCHCWVESGEACLSG